VKADREWRLLHWRALGALRPREVAAVSGLSERAVRRLIEDGRLRATRPSEGALLVPVAAVRELIGEGDGETPFVRPVRERAKRILSRLEARSA
jgi:excisionase family DNA binding protein